MISNKTLSRVEEIDFDAIINSKEPGGLIKHIAMNAMGLSGDRIGPAALVYYGKLTGESLPEDENMLTVIFAITAGEGSESTKLLKSLVAIYQLTKWENESTN